MTEPNSDFVLVRQFLNGSEAAFNKIVIKYQQKIYWHARRMTGNHLDADEIVQEVLLVMYEKLNTFQFKSSLYTWIYRITTTRSLNFLKRRQLRKFFSFEESEAEKIYSSDDIVKNMEDKEKVDIINKALQKIPPKQREVFVLRSFEQLSYDEISEITGKSIGGLKANYFHAVNKITDLINK